MKSPNHTKKDSSRISRQSSSSTSSMKHKVVEVIEGRDVIVPTEGQLLHELIPKFRGILYNFYDIWYETEVWILLMILGMLLALSSAAFYMETESDYDMKQLEESEDEREKMLAEVAEKMKNYNEIKKRSDIEELMYLYGNATELGSSGNKYKWSFKGSLFFSLTIGIGYGETYPTSYWGKIGVLAYGSIMCTCGILFFNIFLERTIAFFTFILKPKSKKSSDDPEGNMDDFGFIIWKPNVYIVLAFMSLLSIIVLAISTSVYSYFEGWDYLTSFYYSFVAFTTIGFGDYVSGHKTSSDCEIGFPYFIINIVILALGAATLYSFLNIIAIVMQKWENKFLRFFNIIEPLPEKDKLGLEAKESIERAITPNDISHTANDKNLISPSLLEPVTEVNDTVLCKSARESAIHPNHGKVRRPLSKRSVSVAVIDASTLAAAQSLPLAELKHLRKQASRRSLMKQASRMSLAPGTVGPMAIASHALAEDVFD